MQQTATEVQTTRDDRGKGVKRHHRRAAREDGAQGIALTHSGTLPGSTMIAWIKLHTRKNIKIWITTRQT